MLSPTPTAFPSHYLLKSFEPPTTMYLFPLLGAITLLISSVLAESSDIFYWPIGSPQPSLLARVTYDPLLNSELVAYHAPSSSLKDDLVRIGFYKPGASKQWVGSLVSLSALTGENTQPTIRLHLDQSHELYHVSLASSTSESKASSSSPQLELVYTNPGTQPHLNRPVVVGPDGQNTDEVPEKSFLQK